MIALSIRQPWATLDGMAGPLPPLPERLAKREQLQGGPEARC
jgi:hypothetical protein